jgi:GntR family transcriptional repressor for pyruvate dehydrogenase complex
MTMNQLQAKTRAELLATQLENQIANGDFGPGEMIGTLDDLKQKSGYARSTVAEAARLLTDRGVAQIRPGRGGGIYVASDGDAMIRIGRTLLTVSGQPSAVSDAIAVRHALEPLIVMDATRHRDEDDIRDLRAILQELADAIPQGTAPFLELNWRLHMRISDITPNLFARNLYRGMLQYTSDRSSSAEHAEPLNDRPWLEMRYQVHRELVEAIASGDTLRANQAVSSHQHSQVHSEHYL